MAAILRQHLGDYVDGLDKEALSIGVLKGDVKLQNQSLKPDAFAQLGLPIKVNTCVLFMIILSKPTIRSLWKQI